MTLTALHGVHGPWLGRLALAARPRGAREWLEDELSHWRNEGIDMVVSLLEEAEELDLDLGGEERAASALGIGFKSLPIADRQVPNSAMEFAKRSTNWIAN